MTDADHMTRSHEAWAKQRQLAAQITDLVEQYTASKYEEYRWLRWCSHEAAYREAQEYASQVCDAAVSSGMNAVTWAELARKDER
jgi:predicted metal-dependent hydrolase